MSWTVFLVVGAAVGVLLILKKSGQISARDAAAHLQNGALVIDVRSPDEFQSGHLRQALNLPLDDLAASAPGRLKDKNQVLLLHCLSGMRSGMAQRKLQALGYANVFNLGSLARARQICGG
ncbi:MAG TPA: rhodanese-like domain-containing protein [Verrucomicrobiae bacterium]|nr:rhodanese-like domain-containing protein [Verrucomicrobiae bacterium]